MITVFTDAMLHVLAPSRELPILHISTQNFQSGNITVSTEYHIISWPYEALNDYVVISKDLLKIPALVAQPLTQKFMPKAAV
jgi:poly(3-hydroxyalkanoate) synthetase